jgi:hypothetical protein
MNGDWGPVIVIKGDHKGKIGYYDDNDSLFSDEENIDPDFWDSDSWRDVEGVEEENLKALDVAIVTSATYS